MFQKQPIMRKVLYSLVPIYLASVYLYGLPVLLISLVVFPIGIGIEFLFERKKNKKVSEAVLVTCALFTLSMPPAIPLWIPAIGIAFAVLFGKMVFGGFGRNIFNPAIGGRLFVYIAFASLMTTAWTAPGFFGLTPIDGVTAATPLAQMRSGTIPSLLMLVLGARAGSLGEGVPILILLAAIYLSATKTASFRIIISTILSAFALNAALYYAGVAGIAPPVEGLFSGSFLFVAVFMATDPVSAPNSKTAHWLYGIIIGCTAMLVRSFSLFPEGTSFGVLMGNTFASALDDIFGKKKAAKKEVKA